MVDLMSQLFGIIGLSIVPPTNIAELIPYLLKICMGFCIVGYIFSWLRTLSNRIAGGKF